jgi:uncharacterized protein YecE (DUF72 family)
LAHAQTPNLSKNLHVGTMGWSYGFWKGGFYPQDLASKDFLTYYAERFNSVEVDNTFYKIPRTQTVIDWKQQAPTGFLFSLKFPQKITHIKMLKDCQDETRVFLEHVGLLEENLGVLLLQFPPMFRQEHFPLLAAYLKALPKEFRYAVEVRNKALLNEALFALLKERNVALALVDSAKMPLVTEKTADFVYVRWEGDRKIVTGTLGKPEADRTVQIQQWADKLKPLLERQLPVFGYFSKYYSGFPPSDVQKFLRQVNT